MIVIKDNKTILLLVPKTGTTSLLSALQASDYRIKMLYRHRGAAGIDKKFRSYRVIGIARPPVERLWSIYKFVTHGVYLGNTLANWNEKDHKGNPRKTFNEWILKGKSKLTTGDPAALQDNINSQFKFLRPDLGTEIYRFDEIDKLAEELGIGPLPKMNRTQDLEMPPLSEEAKAHIREHFAWDLEFFGETLE